MRRGSISILFGGSGKSVAEMKMKEEKMKGTYFALARHLGANQIHIDGNQVVVWFGILLSWIHAFFFDVGDIIADSPFFPDI